MANNWKKLKSKYRARRIFLLLFAIVLILGIGWLLGSRIGGNGSQTLGDSGDNGAPVSSEDTISSVGSEPSEPESVASNPPILQAVSAENWERILVNTTYPLEENFSVDLDRVTGEYSLDSRIVPILKRMIVQAKSEGINLQIFSAYRNPAEQNVLYNQKTEELLKKGFDIDKAQEEAAKTVPKAWTSEHHTGLATDISIPEIGIDNSFDQSAAFKWLDENAEKYGFVLRYPKDKESITHIDYSACHFRYVGEEVAKIMKENDYTLEEYLYMEEKSKHQEILTSEPTDSQ